MQILALLPLSANVHAFLWRDADAPFTYEWISSALCAVLWLSSLLALRLGIAPAAPRARTASRLLAAWCLSALGAAVKLLALSLRVYYAPSDSSQWPQPPMHDRLFALSSADFWLAAGHCGGVLLVAFVALHCRASTILPRTERKRSAAAVLARDLLRQPLLSTRSDASSIGSEAGLASDSDSDTEQDARLPGNPEDRATCCARLSFGYLSPFVARGMRRPVQVCCLRMLLVRICLLLV